MAIIRGYNAPTKRIQPNDTGFAAFETAGRRIGPLYNQAASDYEKIGRLTAESIKQRNWPFNILDLEQASANRGAVNVRAGGSGGRSGGGLGNGSFGGDSGYAADKAIGALDGVNQVSAGAGALGRALSASQDPAQAYSDRLNLQASLTGRLVGTDYGPGGSFQRILKDGEYLDGNGNIYSYAWDPSSWNKQMAAEKQNTDAINASWEQQSKQQTVDQNITASWDTPNPIGAPVPTDKQAAEFYGAYTPQPSETSSFGAAASSVPSSTSAPAEDTNYTMGMTE